MYVQNTIEEVRVVKDDKQIDDLFSEIGSNELKLDILDILSQPALQITYEKINDPYSSFGADIFLNFSDADITHLINFELFKKIIKKNNLKVQGITSQREFLINMGILERAEMISKKLKFTDKANIFYRLRKLIDNKEMGKLFKFMLITNKNIKFKTGFKVD